jgi:hypothetical protein
MNSNNYGFIFNDITINDNTFTKKYKTSFGKKKINYEILFYKYIKKNKLNFSMPLLIFYSDGEITIEYIKKSKTLTNVINKNNFLNYYKLINEEFKNIHFNKVEITSDTLNNDLLIESKYKIINRFLEYDWQSNDIYKYIKTVNNLNIKNINFYCDKITEKLKLYLNDRNILLDSNNKLYLIDPRGYFGNTDLFGIFEYDYAKLMFGMSGYSFFDNLSITNLIINNNNIEIEFIKKYEYIFDSKLFDNITKLFCLSIWLGNNNCFIDINKKITSLMIAYYYCEKYLDLL